MTTTMQLLVVLTVYCILSSEALRDTYDIWYKLKHLQGKNYAGEQEENARKRQFDINLDIIAQHNLKYDVGLFSYTKRANNFSDLSKDEFNKLYMCKLTRNVSLSSKHIVSDALNMADNNANEASVDWRVKGALETQYAIHTQTLVDLSEQQLIDCSKDHGNLGCQGGSMINAYDYLAMYGMQGEASYPYTALDGQCTFSAANVLANVSVYAQIFHGKEDELAIGVAQLGPFAVAFDAEDDLKDYHDGIYESKTCSEYILNYGFLVVGYDTLDGKDYWIVKNSWGDTWGQSGYFYVARNKSNMCGIASEASIPFIQL